MRLCRRFWDLCAWFCKWWNRILHPIQSFRIKKIQTQCKEGFKNLMIDYNKIDPNVVQWKVILECKEDSGMGRIVQIQGKEGIPAEDWDVTWESLEELKHKAWDYPHDE